MDALIRLDMPMPVSDNVPAIENFTGRPMDDDVNDQNTVNDKDEIISLIDCCSNEASPDKEHLIKSSQVAFIDLDSSNEIVQVDLTTAGGMNDENPEHKQASKHKLPPIYSASPSKMPKSVSSCIDNPADSVDVKNLFQNAGTSKCSLHKHSNYDHLHIPIASNVMKNHTVTSNDYENIRDKNNSINTSLQMSLFKPFNISNEKREHPSETSNGSLCTSESDSDWSVLDKIMENSMNELNSNLQNSSNATNKVDLIQNFERKVQSSDVNTIFKQKEYKMIQQLRDIFPDIDIDFLKTNFQLGLDLNQISDLILGMGIDYPKTRPFHNHYSQREISVEGLNNSLKINPSLTDNFVTEDSCFIPSDTRVSLSKNLHFHNSECIINNNEQNLDDLKYAPEKEIKEVEKHSGEIQARRRSLSDSDPEIIFENIQNSKDLKGCTISNDIGTSVNKNGDVVMRKNINRHKHLNLSNLPKNCIEIIDDEARKTETKSPESKLSFLMGIFPDADPAFMEVKSYLTESELENFISANMENSTYPKIAVVKDEKVEEEELNDIGLYTTDFNVEVFLKIFPDPFQYFIDENRVCHFSKHGNEFLKRRYRSHSVKMISKKYFELKHNLVKTCEFLDKEPATRVTKRSISEINMPDEVNLPFLQEACFIEHKNDIKKYLDAIAEAKKQAFDKAKENGELIECGCCYQEVLFEDCAACNEGDLFCKNCIQKSVEVRVGDGLTTFPCLLDCGSHFSLQLLQNLVDARMFSRLLQRIQLDEIKAADIEGLEICPFCEFATIPPPDTNIFTCLNPECLKESCRKCHKLSHIPLRCEEVESDDQARARKYIEDEMTKALVRECYKCKKSFIKIDGCNKMTCTCGAKMCYICRQPVADYNHFNGQGGSEKQKCPLYSTEKVLHVDAVEAVAKKALEDMKSKNPELQLKHDPTKLLPTAESAKTALPPGIDEQVPQLVNLLQQYNQHFRHNIENVLNAADFEIARQAPLQRLNAHAIRMNGLRDPFLLIPPYAHRVRNPMLRNAAQEFLAPVVQHQRNEMPPRDQH